MTPPVGIAAVLLALAVLAVGVVPRAGAARLSALARGRGGGGRGGAPDRPPRLRVGGATRSGVRSVASRPRALTLAAGSAGVVAGVVLGGPAAGAATGLLGAAAATGRRRRAEARAAARERARALEACLALAAELRAGRTPADALAEAAEVATGGVGEALAAAARTAVVGGDVSEVLSAARPTAADELLRALAACWAVCATTGAALAPAVDRLADGLVADADRRRSVAAEVAGPQATAVLLAGLPLAGVVLGAGLGADPLHVLLATPTGGACLVLGTCLDLLGLAWTRRLVQRALRA